MGNIGSNIIVYILTLIIVAVFIYFIYKYVYGSSTFQTNLIMGDKILAKVDSNGGKVNVKIPDIHEGGEFSINFWIYISDYGNYRANTRKHLVEIGCDTAHNTRSNFSTILIALGGSTATLLVRTHTMPSDSYNTVIAGHNYGITDCSGTDCSGASPKRGFQPLSDVNLANNLKDNSLTVPDMVNFFKPFAPGSLDEQSVTNDNATLCDVKDIPLQKWINICTVMNAKTLDIYMDGRLVKTCVYKNYYKIDNAGGGPVLHYLKGNGVQQGFDGYFSRLQVFNTSLTPDDIYKNYLAGPTGSSATNDPVSFLKYIFTG